MIGALKQIKNRMGPKKFPFIDITYYSNHKQMVIAPPMPAVIKGKI